MNRLTTSSRIDTDALERENGFRMGLVHSPRGGAHRLGALAFLNLPPAGTVSVYAVGIVMVIGAFAQLGTSLLVPGWRRIGLLVLSAIFYGAAGIFAIVNPRLAATPLTLLLAFALISLRHDTVSVDVDHAVTARVGLGCGIRLCHRRLRPHIHPLVARPAGLAPWRGACCRSNFSGRNGNRIRTRSRCFYHPAISSSMTEP